eukprot:gene29767-5415_t
MPDVGRGDLKYFQVMVDENQDGKITYDEFMSAAQAAIKLETLAHCGDNTNAHPNQPK